ncbi:efflux RND transporter periplasmic adaptor subunit [Maricaulis parjimensis]|uniref:efflux RND transporter periplasmic adaptor subunit n=1 Tax=Maricaulis parjimensis TaxID=144023 RepID=UPI001939A4CA|nr:efflux RND transporter periplasmic adaptor subunit [Maricaulis parjimensis]
MPYRLAALCGAFFASFALAACSAGEAEPVAAQQPMPNVEIAAPLVQEVADWDEFTGRFESPQHVSIRARVSGYLETVHVRDGQTVEAGDLLFTLDRRPYEAAYDAARGRAAMAQANARQAQADLQRAEELRGVDAISQESLEQAQTALANARASLATAQADAEAARLNLEFTEIRAPISGQLSARTSDPGDLVQGSTAQGDPLITIVSSDPLYFPFYASESVLLRYQRSSGTGEGAPVEVRLQDEADYSRSGEIVFVDNQIQPGSGTILMRAEIANPDGFIRPGMIGTIRVRGSDPYEALLVPRTAILSDATRRLVYVVDAENKVSVRSVVLGPTSDNLQVVQSGLNRSDRVIIAGLQGLRPGMSVTTHSGSITRDVQPADVTAALNRPAGTARVTD